MDRLSQPDAARGLDSVDVFGARTGLMGRVSSRRGVEILATHGMPNERTENHITADATTLIYTLRMPTAATISRGSGSFRSVGALGLFAVGHSFILRSSSPFTCSCCFFSPGFLAGLSETESGLRIGELNLVTPIESERLTYFGTAMLREATVPGFASSLFAESVAMSVAIEIARLDGALCPDDGPRRGGLALWQMRRLESYVRDHLSDHLTMDDLARLLGISVRYLSRAVRQAKGVSVHRWIAERRISEARKLLAGTDLLIHDVARRCAFNNGNAFAAAFRATSGCTPGEFRRLALGYSPTESVGADA